MTMRTHRHFICPNQHEGKETTSENDQPYSEHWESVRLTNMKSLGEDAQGKQQFACEQCGLMMTEKP